MAPRSIRRARRSDGGSPEWHEREPIRFARTALRWSWPHAVQGSAPPDARLDCRAAAQQRIVAQDRAVLDDVLRVAHVTEPAEAQLAPRPSIFVSGPALPMRLRSNTLSRL